MFQNSKEIRCLISTQMEVIFEIPLNIILVIFVSPPKKMTFYSKLYEEIKNIKYSAVLYNKKEKYFLSKIKEEFKVAFFELTLPEEISEEKK